MKPEEERRYERLSPFELKHKLVQLARHRGERMMLNAGRGNPNWVALEPRHALLQLGLFAMAESERVSLSAGFGGAPRKEGIAGRFAEFAAARRGVPGIALLEGGVAYARDRLGIDPEALLDELAGAVLGDHYPTPGRMLAHAERVVAAFLADALFAGAAPAGRLELFGVEGATAAITYIFNSLAQAGLINKGDRIALGTPIFTPYLEVPKLNDYELTEIEVMQDEDLNWQYPDTELDKLRDPGVKAFFLVNPSNPTSVALDSRSVARIGEIVRTARPDLVIITDDVYATFSDGFRSIAAAAPRNTILVYSWSKFWGATGWRLGVICLPEDNTLDERIATMPEAVREVHRRRYGTIALEPERLKLIDRMVADSRAVGLNHTAGLSTPQQAQMVLFALHWLLDAERDYQRTAKEIVRRRFAKLYEHAGIPAPRDPHFVYYYATLDIPALARVRYGEAFARWLKAEHEPIDFVARLAEEKSVVLMDGGGFDAPQMSVRVSLANLPDEAYARIGEAIAGLLADYHRGWKARSKI